MVNRWISRLAVVLSVALVATVPAACKGEGDVKAATDSLAKQHDSTMAHMDSAGVVRDTTRRDSTARDTTRRDSTGASKRP